MRAHRDLHVRAATMIGLSALGMAAVMTVGGAFRAAVAQPQPISESAPRGEAPQPPAANDRSSSNPRTRGVTQLFQPSAEPLRPKEAAPASPAPSPEAAEPVPANRPLDRPSQAGPRVYQVPLSRTVTDRVTLRQQQGRLSLIVRDAPLGDVLTRLAETQGLNLVTAESLAARLTITLDQVTLEQALDAILSVAGYTWVRNQDIVFVTSLAQGTNVSPEMQGRRWEVMQLDFVAAADLQTVVTGMLSPVGKSYVLESKADDSRKTQEILVVEDVPQYLDRIRDYVAQADQPPRQVLIEAHILQIDLDDVTNQGVNFERLFQLFNKEVTVNTTGFAKEGASPAFSVHINGGDLDALLQCLKTTTDAKTLASPRVLVVNGQTARIQVGQRFGYRVTTTTETMTSETVDFLDVGVVLEVTPRVSRDGRVLMKVKPEVSNGSVDPTTGLPNEDTTEVQTNVMLHDGQGIVIGGLIKETNNDGQSKVPWLGDLRWIGKLFRQKDVTKKRAEIVVALLPRVIPYDPVYQEQDAVDLIRAQTPLFCGPLVPHPRPWEPILPDAVYNPVPLLRLPPICDDCLHARCSACRPSNAYEDAGSPPEAVRQPNGQDPVSSHRIAPVAPAAYTSGVPGPTAPLDPLPPGRNLPPSAAVGYGHVEQYEFQRPR